MAERPQPPASDGGGYPVPPQIPAPPDAAPVSPWSRSATGGPAPPPPLGPPLAAAEDPAAGLWGPSAAPSEPDRWGAAPPGRHGAALLDRPTAARRPVVAPPVGPMPPSSPADSWSWERSHGLRNALLAAVAILLIGSLMAAFIVFRNRDDDPRKALIEPPPATLPPPDGTLQPVAPGQDTVPFLPPVTPPNVVPVPPATAATTAPRPAAPPTTARPPTPAPAPAPVRPTPTVTASPPHPSCPPICPTTSTSRPRSTTTTPLPQ